MLARIDLIRPEELVFPELLEPVCQPARDSRHRKKRREQVAVDAHFLVNDPRIKIHIWIDFLTIEQFNRPPFDADGDVVELGGAARAKEFLAQAL